MGVRTLFGCAGLRGDIANYARRFDVLELDLLDRDAPPKAGALRRMRRDAGPNLQVSLVVPKALAAVRPGEALDAALERVLEAQRLVQARFLLLRTPTDVSPADLQRERLQRVIARLREGLGEAKDIVRIAWEPRGVWESDAAARFARTEGIDLALDPLADPREPFFDTALRYWRLGTVGGRTAFPPTRLRFLAEVIAAESKQKGLEGERVVVFTTAQAPRDAKQLKTLARGLESRAPAAGGAIIRPRGSLSLGEEE